jgi:hypothetical protein
LACHSSAFGLLASSPIAARASFGAARAWGSSADAAVSGGRSSRRAHGAARAA